MNETDQTTTQPITTILDRLNADHVIGEPITQGAVTMLPVAAVKVQYTASEPPQIETSTRPLGFLRLTPQGARFQGIENTTVIVACVMGMISWCVFWITEAIRTGLVHQPAAPGNAESADEPPGA